MYSLRLPPSHVDSSPGDPTPSTVNNPPPPASQPHGNDFKVDDINITGLSTPSKSNQTKPSFQDTATSPISSWKKLEIHLLNDIIDFYNKNGTYPFDDEESMHTFYNKWNETRGFCKDEDELKNKIVESCELFLNFAKDFKDAKDPIEIKTFLLSYKIWGIDDYNDEDDDDEDKTKSAIGFNVTGLSTPNKSNQTKPSIQDTATSSISLRRKLLEIDLLNDMIEFYNKNGTYPCDDSESMHKFYKKWNETRVFCKYEEVLYRKMLKLELLFMTSADNLALHKRDPIEIKIYQLSHQIWGVDRGDDDDDYVDDDDDNDEYDDDGN